MSTNPWRNLPRSAPYVLPEDKLAVDVFNDRFGDENTCLHLDTPPEPFLGRLDAPIVVLLLNPGVNKAGEYDENLPETIRNSEQQTKHFYIDQGGNRWWERLVRKLATDRPKSDISQSILSVEFFPYRSKAFGCGHVRLPSQVFSFSLVKAAISRKAAIIIARGERHWLGALPELQAHSLIRMANPRVASLSPTNLGADNYRQVLSSIRERR